MCAVCSLQLLLYYIACAILLQDACILLGHAMDSPLMIAINAGTKTLGPLMHITKVMQQKQLPPEWGPKAELPVSILF